MTPIKAAASKQFCLQCGTVRHSKAQRGTARHSKAGVCAQSLFCLAHWHKTDLTALNDSTSIL